MLKDFSDRYKPQTLAELVRELSDHIPHDADSQEQPDSEDLRLFRHQSRYQKFRQED